MITAADALADAFDTYDEALLQAFGEVTPLEIYDGDSIEEFEDEEEEPWKEDLAPAVCGESTSHCKQ